MKAIAYFCNGIGNLVMMLPALQAVASLTETNTIDILLGEWDDNRKGAVLEILKQWPVADKVLEPPYRLRSDDYDLWFFSQHGKNGDITVMFREKIVRPVPKPSWRTSMIHETDHYMEVAYSLGYKGEIPQVQFPLAEKPDLSALPRPIIGICNGFFRTDYWKKKAWPHFDGLVHNLKHYFNGTVIGVGESGELDGVDLEPENNFCGKLTITETAKVISQMDLLITSDTGNMHIADILGVPTVTLFGSTLGSKNSPRNKQSVTLMSGVECAPCQDTGRFYNCKDYLCMKSITVGDVMAVVRQKINQPFK